jgi:hypothetical protein
MGTEQTMKTRVTYEENNKIVADAISRQLPKARCHTDNAVLFHYTAQGLSFRCRHCKGVQVVPWEEVLLKYQELDRKSVI